MLSSHMYLRCDGKEKAFSFNLPERLAKLLEPVSGHPDKVQCTLRNSTFGMAYQGKHDIKRNLESRTHKRLAQVVNSCHSLTSLLPNSSSQKKVTNAEVLFTGFILEQNFPFEAATHAGPVS